MEITKQDIIDKCQRDELLVQQAGQLSPYQLAVYSRLVSMYEAGQFASDGWYATITGAMHDACCPEDLCYKLAAIRDQWEEVVSQ